MLDGRCALKACLLLLFTDRHQVIRDTPRVPVAQARSPSGLVSDGGKCTLPGRDFSPAKCTPLTNELTDHTPLNGKKETVHRNVKAKSKECLVSKSTETCHTGVPDDHTSG